MIKINLLPPSINEKRIVRNTAILFAVLLVAILAAGFTYYMKLSQDVTERETLATQTEEWQKRVEGIEQQATEVRTSYAIIKQKLDFIQAVLAYNEQYPNLFEQVAKWTYEKVTLTSMQCNGATLQMQAKVKTLDDLGRYLLNMYRATDLFTSVSISALPGYPRQNTGQGQGQPQAGPGTEGGGAGPQANLAGIEAINTSIQQKAPGANYIDFTVTCQLKRAIMPPSFGAASAGSSGARTMSGASMAGPSGGPASPPM